MILLADKITPAVKAEVDRIDSYMRRIGSFTAGLAPHNAVKLRKSGKTAFDITQAVSFGNATGVVDAYLALDRSFAGWLGRNPVFAFNPVKAPAEARFIQINLAGVTGNGKIELLQNGVTLTVFEVNQSSGKIVSPRKVKINSSHPVIFQCSGAWQGKLLDWKML